MDQPVDGSIASEATELELTDRIFAHREDESVLAEDHKLAAVELDHPSEEAVVGTLESEELEVKDASEALTDYDDLAQEFEEAIEGVELEEAASAETPEAKPAGEDQAQTASVREQGGRSHASGVAAHAAQARRQIRAAGHSQCKPRRPTGNHR